MIVVEILAPNLRQNADMGLSIKINNDENCIQISQLAYDTALVFKDVEAVIKSIKIVLKSDKEKTEGLWLEREANRKDHLGGIAWNKDSVRALGVYIGCNKTEMKKKTLDRKNWKYKQVFEHLEQ